MIDFQDDGGVVSVDAEDPNFLLQVANQYESQESWEALSHSAKDTFNSKYNSELVAQKFEKLLK